MTDDSRPVKEYPVNRCLFGFSVVVVLGILFFFLWTEHKAHLLGALPYLLLLLCPVMHFFMHKRHHHGHGHHDDTNKEGKA